MDTKMTWLKIISNLSKEGEEFPTTPKNNRSPVWFSASTDGDIIYIDKAKNNKPSSNLSMTRKLTFNIFEKVYPFYYKRENGEQVSKEVGSITVDQVYYYSLIHHLGK